MQTLLYEAKWDKALSKQDRDLIEQRFLKEREPEPGICFSVLRQAVNYKGELLVITLIHNNSSETLDFQDKVLRYIDENGWTAQHAFTLSALSIPPETSMPWTFIFPAEVIPKSPLSERGQIEQVS